jgi:uncharacterized protein
MPALPTNRLARESSPYLLQHAHNPVDWYPWGDEAFAEARRRDVPILLSIGYSTCYWCHVMERESFENAEIGALLSKNFVCIKVDREERPDVDDIYMSAVVLTRGSGGWPLNVFLDPHTLKPFWAGTYFPPEPRGGMPGLPQITESIAAAWRDKREDVIAQSQRVAEAIADHLAAKAMPESLDESCVKEALTQLLKMFDRNHGGFGGAPKFPQPVFLDFLLDVRRSAGDDSTADAVDEAISRTLTKMAIGGIYDHVGGGFHRYSVDATWTVPHFEKMLYDNAQLATTYARAIEAGTDNAFFANVLRGTLDFVLREMTSGGGAFFSAQDAEVDHREGLNYLWTEAQIRAALAESAGDAQNAGGAGGAGDVRLDDAALAVKVYSLDLGANFQDPHHPDEPASNVLRMHDRPERMAASLGVEPGILSERLASINARLYRVRSARKQPHLDDKVLTAWNGMMIAAFARGARVLREQRYLDAAQNAAAFLLQKHVDESGELRRVSREGPPRTAAFLEDFAFFVQGLIEVHRTLLTAGASGSTPFLDAAAALASRADQLFSDTMGGLYDTRAGQSDLFVRVATTHDGAIPCGSSVMLHNLIDLYELTDDTAYRERALRLAGGLSAHINHGPVGSINATRAVYRLLIAGAGDELAALGSSPARETREAKAEVFPVEVYASTERVTIPVHEPGAIKLSVRILPGYHVPAADPGPGGRNLIPFRVGLVGGSGLNVFADYPSGEAFGPSRDLLAYTGEFELTVVLERAGEWRGTPLISVSFQACTETECLRPQSIELDVALDRG